MSMLSLPLFLSCAMLIHYDMPKVKVKVRKRLATFLIAYMSFTVQQDYLHHNKNLYCHSKYFFSFDFVGSYCHALSHLLDSRVSMVSLMPLC